MAADRPPSPGRSPWKSYFQEEGVDITGIISSEAGGTTVRNMVAGGVIFGEMNLAAFIAAVQQGAKLDWSRTQCR